MCLQGPGCRTCGLTPCDKILHPQGPDSRRIAPFTAPPPPHGNIAPPRDLVFADSGTLISRHSADRELEQAVRFLHDNGTLLHYEDPLLADFYFVDPQWLCDMLAHIITVREINPFMREGISINPLSTGC